jgi:hexosaminidase
MKKITGSLLIISALFFFVSCDDKNEIEAPVAEVNIIPEPLSLKRSEGTFEIEDDTKFILTSKDERLSKAAGIFADEINRSSSFVLKPEFSKKPDNEAIVVSLTGDTAKFGSEGYSLEVTPDNIFIVAATQAGAFYGMQTLRQLFPPELEDTTFIADEWKIPAVKIFDKPQFHWRGQLFDVSRHFYPLEFVKKNIDYLARYKMNVYHLHLTDDQGWRIEIKKYPKLTSIGAWRVDYNDMDWWKRPAQKPGDKATYGGYYTQEQIKDLVKYAADRFITVLPEIDVPGHSQAIIASYPEVSCDGRQYYVATGGVAKDNTVCPGKGRTFEFLEGVLDEVIPLFPG